MNQTNEVPAKLSTGGGTVWRLRPDLEVFERPGAEGAGGSILHEGRWLVVGPRSRRSGPRPGVVYQQSAAGPQGIATGRVLATIAQQDGPQVMAWLESAGFGARRIHAGEIWSVVIEGMPDALAPLRSLATFSTGRGVLKAMPEILMVKSSREKSG